MAVHKKLEIIKIISISLIFFLTLGACNRGSGCPSEEANTKTNKKGMPTSKAKSGLFDKKMTKKMGKS